MRRQRPRSQGTSGWFRGRVWCTEGSGHSRGTAQACTQCSAGCLDRESGKAGIPGPLRLSQSCCCRLCHALQSKSLLRVDYGFPGFHRTLSPRSQPPHEDRHYSPTSLAGKRRQWPRFGGRSTSFLLFLPASTCTFCL